MSPVLSKDRRMASCSIVLRALTENTPGPVSSSLTAAAPGAGVGPDCGRVVCAAAVNAESIAAMALC